MPSRRHCRQTGPMYLSKLLSPYLTFRCGLRPLVGPSSRLRTPLPYGRGSDAPLLRRTTSIVGNRRDVLDGAHFDARGRQRSDRRFAAGTRSADPYFHDPQSAFTSLVGGSEGG